MQRCRTSAAAPGTDTVASLWLCPATPSATATPCAHGCVPSFGARPQAAASGAASAKPSGAANGTVVASSIGGAAVPAVSVNSGGGGGGGSAGGDDDEMKRAAAALVAELTASGDPKAILEAMAALPQVLLSFLPPL